MKKVLFTIILLIATKGVIFSQFNLMVAQNTAINPSAPGNCDGSIHVDSTINGVGPFSYNLVKDNSIYQVSTSPYFYNLCEGQYILMIYDSNCKVYAALFLLETFTSRTEATTIRNLDITNESSTSMCDGTITFEVNNFVPGTVVMTNDGIASTSYVNSILNANPMTINNTCTNNDLGYFVTTNDTLDENYGTAMGIDASTFYPYWSTFNSACGGFYVWTETVPSADTLSCDGIASTVVWGGVPPFSYSYSSGGTNYQETGLCPGYYNVMVTDANGDTTSSAFVVTDSAHINEMYFWGSPYDTLYTNAIQNCSLDYNLPIDTAILDSVIYESAYDLAVYYTIVQDTNEFYWAETFHIDSVSNYMVSMSFYCENRALDNVYTILAPLPLAEIMMLNVPRNIVQTNQMDLKIYPNPFSDLFYFEFNSSESENLTIEIMDISGRIIFAEKIQSFIGENLKQVNLEETANGIYLLNLKSDNQILGSQKIIKN